MSRSAIVYGLSEEAKSWLKINNAAIIDSKRINLPDFNTSFMCNTYKITDVSYVKEVVQCYGTLIIDEIIQNEVWDNGPKIFLCLKDPKINNIFFKWSDKQLFSRLGGKL